MASIVMRIDGRFCGPPGSGNGGYVAGRLAGLLGGDVEVTLRKPVPVDRPLAFIPEPKAGVRLETPDGALLAEARRLELDLDLPDPVRPEEAREGAARFPRFEGHPIPGCFVCGVEREAPDGLRLFPGPVPGREDVIAAPWVLDSSLPRAGDAVAPEIVWAALDCPGAFAVNEPPRGVALLGRIAARILDRPAAGDRCVVAGWPVAGREGRKLHAGTALWSAEGRLLAFARATWILSRP